jgi:hypothetical protein
MQSESPTEKLFCLFRERICSSGPFYTVLSLFDGQRTSVSTLINRKVILYTGVCKLCFRLYSVLVV